MAVRAQQKIQRFFAVSRPGDGVGNSQLFQAARDFFNVQIIVINDKVALFPRDKPVDQRGHQALRGDLKPPLARSIIPAPLGLTQYWSSPKCHLSGDPIWLPVHLS